MSEMKEFLYNYYKKNPDSLDRVIKLVEKDKIFYDEQYNTSVKHVRMLEDFKKKLEED